jgi:hypothetical protein
MNYVQRVLQPGEQVRQISSIHWIWPGVAVALLAVVAYWLGDTRLLPGFWRYPAENFGRGWWVVDVAVDRGAIRHDLFPKRSGLLRRPRSKML